MSVAPQLPHVRPLAPHEAEEAGEVLFLAFGAVYAQRGFRPPFPSADAGTWLVRAYLELDPTGAVVALQGSRIAGVGFVHVRGAAASIGPVAARPGAPPGIGRAVMERLLAIADAAGARSVRLFQDAFNPRSFALYAKLGFVAAETVVYTVAEPARPAAVPQLQGGARVREIRPRDLPALLALDRELLLADRALDFSLILDGGGGLALWRGPRVDAFLFVREGAARVALAPGAARDAADLLALAAIAAEQHAGRALSARVASHPASLVRGMFALGFRVDHLGNLMVRGETRREGAHLHAMFPESL
jgi:ribosomal protein S18 acetylase RimI-like enzyme